MVSEKILHNLKILNISAKSIYAADGYSVYSFARGNMLEYKVSRIERSCYSLLSSFFLTRRLFRAEITALYELGEGAVLTVAKKGIYRKNHAQNDFRKVFSIPRGSKPLNLCILPNGHIFFGEYFQNLERDKVNVYGSEDGGMTWHIAYSFASGNINHIHGLFYDPYTSRIWVLTGDRENECIIGYTDDEFFSFHEFLRGGQEYRSCQLFFYEDFIVYVTDSQYIGNEIRAIDRRTCEITVLTEVQGSVIKGGQTGKVSYISTTVEPSPVNRDDFSHVWLTEDGCSWREVYRAKKDWLPAVFQFATFEFPQNAVTAGKLWLSGRALSGHDGKKVCIEI